MFYQPDIRVVVADQHFLFRRGLRALLGEAAGIEVIGEAACLDDVLGAVHTHAPDLLLLDAGLSGADFQIIKQIGRERPEIRVLLLVAATENRTATHPEETGAFAWLPKEAPASDLVNAIRNAAPPSTSSILNLAKVHGRAVSPMAEPNRPTLKSLLTRREQEVLDLLMQAGTSREIAATLGLSLKTVESHKFNLMRKLDVHSRSELIKLALREQMSPYAGELVRN
jgi:two-component system, NarL family, response regulator NreC